MESQATKNPTFYKTKELIDDKVRSKSRTLSLAENRQRIGSNPGDDKNNLQIPKRLLSYKSEGNYGGSRKPAILKPAWNQGHTKSGNKENKILFKADNCSKAVSKSKDGRKDDVVICMKDGRKDDAVVSMKDGGKDDAVFSLQVPLVWVCDETFVVVSKPNLPEHVISIDIEDGMYEYAGEVIKYLQERELKYVLGSNFMDGGSTKPEMRAMLVDWLIQVQHHLNLCQETLYLTITMLDTVLSKRDINSEKLQLVGVTCFLMASKLEEYYPADIHKLIHLTSDSYSMKQILRMELVILEILEFQLHFPEIMTFMRRFVRAAFRGQDTKFLRTCLYLVDSVIVDQGFSTATPSKQASASILAASLIYFYKANKEDPTEDSVWSSTLEFYTSYPMLDLLTTASTMIRSLMGSKYTGATNKYKSQSRHQGIARDEMFSAANLGRVESWLNK